MILTPWAQVGQKSIKRQIHLTIIVVWVMFALDILLYSVLIAYVDKVAPGKYGVAEKWYFFLLPSYWCPVNKVAVEEGESSRGDAVDDISMFEPEPKMTAGIKVNNLRKEFKKVTCPAQKSDLNLFLCFQKFGGETVYAVNGVTFSAYEGEITALLGHNGAGNVLLVEADHVTWILISNWLQGRLPRCPSSLECSRRPLAQPPSMATTSRRTCQA